MAEIKEEKSDCRFRKYNSSGHGCVPYLIEGAELQIYKGE